MSIPIDFFFVIIFYQNNIIFTFCTIKKNMIDLINQGYSTQPMTWDMKGVDSRGGF